MLRIFALLFGFLIILSPCSVFAQFNRLGLSRARQPSRSQHVQKSTSRHNAGTDESQIVVKIQAMEREMQQAGRWLEQQLARAGQIRQRGLQSNDKQILNQAEQMEQQALLRHGKWIKQFDQFSARLDRMTKAQAQSKIQAHKKSQQRARPQSQTASQTPTRANNVPRRMQQRGASRHYRSRSESYRRR